MSDITSPELMQDVYDAVIDMLKEHNISPENKAESAYKVIEAIEHKWSGLLVYIPKKDGQKMKKRNANIKKDFTGDNHSDLCRKYKISLQTVYRILKQPTQGKHL